LVVHLSFPDGEGTVGGKREKEGKTRRAEERGDKKEKKRVREKVCSEPGGLPTSKLSKKRGKRKSVKTA